MKEIRENKFNMSSHQHGKDHVLCEHFWLFVPFFTYNAFNARVDEHFGTPYAWRNGAI